jgi:hypothetical protein
LPEGIIFITQEQIDNFQSNYPGCTEIEGEVRIGYFSYSDISNLNGLNVLTSIGGHLIIELNVYLFNLTGLDNLYAIGGSLHISSNPNLQNLSGLNDLSSIGGWLQIEFNNTLSSLTGLDDLSSLGGLDIHNNHNLTSLTGLNNLSSIGDLLIEGNSHLTSLAALEKLTSIEYALYICYNSSLSSCEVQGVCDFLSDPNGTITIYDNAPGCNSKEEVETACQGISIKEITIDNLFSMFPNPSSTQITIEIPEISHRSLITIMNLNGQELIQYQITDPKTVIEITNLPRGVYFVRLTNDRTVEIEKIIKV